ncbi:unnamed protein product [Adineta steineri]|uniref:MRH domain-containing protein n=1 Tax=Adineta steineri TaxID=433720 RepID=A0A813TCE2_9BILA|nr:unnamed protein product [Adineta steineri]CAF1534586.1 unnamed protein product [Adineta steineri]
MNRIILILLICCGSINANCNSPSDDESKIAREKLIKWKIYNKTYQVKGKTSTYEIGICSTPNNSINNGDAIIQKLTNSSSSLGQLSQSNLVGEDNWILLTYENGSRFHNQCENKTRSASILFICGKKTGNITVIQESCNYVFQFQVAELCTSVVQVKNKMSGGAIFIIIILCLASAYLIGGFFYMRIQRGARGIDQIPNLDMWRKLGNLAADGCNFCCRCKTDAARSGYIFDDSGPDLRGDDDILAP